jgi:chromosome segregation ATPase
VKPTIETANRNRLPSTGHKIAAASYSNTSTTDHKKDEADIIWAATATKLQAVLEKVRIEKLLLSFELHESKRDAASHVRTIEKLNIELEASKARNDELASQLDVSKEEVDATKVRNAELDTQLDASKEVVDATKVRNAELAFQLDVSKGEVAMTRRELDASADIINNLKQLHNSQLDASKAQLEKVTEQFQAERNALSMALDASREETSELRNLVDGIRELLG